MKRNWDVIENILSHIEAEDIADYVKKEMYIVDLDVCEKEYFGHIEILAEAGLIKRCDIIRSESGKIKAYYFNGPFITMQGHDLLDAMRDKTVWNRIKSKSIKAGVTLSWEFIKAAIPAVMREIVGG